MKQKMFIVTSVMPHRNCDCDMEVMVSARCHLFQIPVTGEINAPGSNFTVNLKTF